MHSEIQWHTVTVLGHQLEEKLQSLTNEGYEIVSVDKNGSRWMIVAHRSKKNFPAKKPIGFQAV